MTLTLWAFCIRNLKVILRQRYISHQQGYRHHLLGVGHRFCVCWWSWRPQEIYLFSFVHTRNTMLVSPEDHQLGNSVGKFWPQLPKGSRIIRASWGVVHKNFQTSRKCFPHNSQRSECVIQLLDTGKKGGVAYVSSIISLSSGWLLTLPSPLLIGPWNSFFTRPRPFLHIQSRWNPLKSNQRADSTSPSPSACWCMERYVVIVQPSSTASVGPHRDPALWRTQSNKTLLFGTMTQISQFFSVVHFLFHMEGIHIKST